MGIDSTGPVTELESIRNKIVELGGQILDVENANRLLFDATGLRQWENDLVRAANTAEIAFLRQKESVLQYTQALQDGTGNQRALITNAERSIDRMNLLGDEDLAGLRSALAAANSQLQQMTENSESALNNLQDELDRINGNTEAIQDRQYEARKAQLQEQLDQARKFGNQEAIQSYMEALKVLEEVRKAQKAANSGSASSASSASASSSSSSASSSGSSSGAGPSPGKVIEIKFGNETMSPSFGTEKEYNAFLAMLEQFKNRSAS